MESVPWSEHWATQRTPAEKVNLLAQLYKFKTDASTCNAPVKDF